MEIKPILKKYSNIKSNRTSLSYRFISLFLSFHPSPVTLYEEFLCIHCSPRRMHESLSPHSQNDDPPLSADDNIHIIFF